MRLARPCARVVACVRLWPRACVCLARGTRHAARRCGLIPILEPELLSEGQHDIRRAASAASRVCAIATPTLDTSCTFALTPPQLS